MLRERRVPLKKLTTRPEAFLSTAGVRQIFGPLRIRSDDLFDYQLTDPGLRGQLHGFVTRVVEQTADLATIVGVNHTGEHVNSLLRSQTGTRRDAPVVAIGYGHRQSRRSQHPFLRPQSNRGDRIKIQTRRFG